MARKTFEMELKVGLFVTIGVGLIMLAILMLGGANSLFTRHNTYTAHFPSVEGLITGAKVVLGGLNIGAVESVEFDTQTKNIRVELRVKRKYADLIRKDSSAEILTQGVLGDKFISLSFGSEDAAPLEPGSEITYKPTKDLAQFISKGDQLMITLNQLAGGIDRIVKQFEQGNRADTFFQGMSTTARNLGHFSAKLNEGFEVAQFNSAVRNLNEILQKVNRGNGTLGALVNDPALYDDVKSLVGGANRNRIVRNLVRKTIQDEEAKTAEPKK